MLDYICSFIYFSNDSEVVSQENQDPSDNVTDKVQQIAKRIINICISALLCYLNPYTFFTAAFIGMMGIATINEAVLKTVRIWNEYLPITALIMGAVVYSACLSPMERVVVAATSVATLICALYCGNWMRERVLQEEAMRQHAERSL